MRKLARAETGGPNPVSGSVFRPSSLSSASVSGRRRSNESDSLLQLVVAHCLTWDNCPLSGGPGCVCCDAGRSARSGVDVRAVVGCIKRAMHRLVDSVSKLHPFIVFGLGLLFVLLMGLVDFITGPELASSLFYLLPVFLVTWFVGPPAGFGVSVVCAAVWLFDDWLSAVEHHGTVVPWSNMLLELGLFLLFTSVISSLKAALEREKVAIQAQVAREIEIASEVQTRLFPRYLPPLTTLDYAGACRPAAGVGGDYYDFLSPSPSLLVLAVADVSGKGISAALLMASLQGILRAQTLVGYRALDTIAVQLNRLLFESTEGTRYATVFLSLYDNATRELTYVNAGHNPPVLVRSGRGDGGSGYAVERLQAGGMAVGLFADVSFDAGSVSLCPGDLLVLYTDGVTEAMNASGEEYGEPRLLECVNTHVDLSCEDLLRRVLACVEAHVGDTPQHDDMTLVLAKVR
jgi:serine phosphatase RsbU (regulator of sigma subunit)